ncbi:hypothetical protein SAMN05421875_101351 [Acidovorax soli]|uniref:Uncharacterized protein n=1 Tax=Acidovorax soli TaxID=592050 RepID=A0A1H3VS13_9BURK|nr:hypothetical protein SAMN05421875_101351 [Acidovorax soli]
MKKIFDWISNNKFETFEIIFWAVLWILALYEK